MAKTPNRIEVTLFFPLFDKDGNPFDRETWRWWQREMKKLDVDFLGTGPRRWSLAGAERPLPVDHDRDSRRDADRDSGVSERSA